MVTQMVTVKPVSPSVTVVDQRTVIEVVVVDSMCSSVNEAVDETNRLLLLLLLNGGKEVK